MEYQPSAVPHLFSALCVNTIDPMAVGRVQFYTPYLTRPGTEIDGLPWAYPVSPFGGFDDCGVTWIPPAGSKLALLCENGDKNQAYYIGTFFPRTRGKAAGNSSSSEESGEVPANQDESRNDLWSYIVPEYDCRWEGSRDGYNLGPNDGSQVRQPWNTDNYQTKDWDTQTDFDKSENAQKLITYPHQYGFKTPEKHYMKMVDGDSRCNHRYRRVEMASGRGNIFMMKDDHLHPASQWAFDGTDEGAAVDQAKQCANRQGPLWDCEDDAPNQQPTCDETLDKTDSFSNPFYKRQEEMRFYNPVSELAKYRRPKCELPQSGVQIQSLSGQQFVMDDSVDQPKGEPRWNLDFDFGCTDIFKGKMFLWSATGHLIEMNDSDDDTLLRSQDNGIKFETATGHSFFMCDHTIGDTSSPEEAGEFRGIRMESTAKHLLEFHDQANKQYGLPRQEGGEPQALSDKAYVLLRSGYGLQLMMRDADSQEDTQHQQIELLAPMKDNPEKGPHTLIFQEAPEGEPGLVFLRCGGNFVFNSVDDWQEIVGSDEENPKPANKSVQVQGKYIVNVGEYYFNKNALTMFQADSYIYLLAGKDCPQPNPGTGAEASATTLTNAQIAAESLEQGTPNELPFTKGPCIHPVVLAKEPFICPYTQFIHFGLMFDPADPTHTKFLHNSISDRVFASGSDKDAQDQ